MDRQRFESIRERKVVVLALAFAVALSFSISYPSMSSYFVTDDLRLIYISSPITVNHIEELFTSSGGWFAGFYRPLVRLAFYADYTLYELNPFGYHFTNFLFHAGCILALFFFARIVTKNEAAAACSALIFSVHPIHTEAVTWISGRNDVIFTLFYILSLTSYLKYIIGNRDKKYYLFLSVAGFILSLLSKESAITLPIMLLFSEIYLNKTNAAEKKLKIRYFEYLIYVGVIVAYQIIKILYIGKGIYDKKDWGSTISGTVYFFFQLFAPINVDAITGGDFYGLCLNLAILALSGLVAMAALSGIRRKSIPLSFIAYCAAWIVVTSFPIYFVPGARFLYVSSVLSSIFIGTAMMEISKMDIRFKKAIIGILISGILATSSIRTVDRNEIYNRAGAVSNGILSQLKDKYSEFPKGSVLYFFNVPQDWVRDSESWVKPIPVLNIAVQVKYADTSLTVKKDQNRSKTIEQKVAYLEKNSIRRNMKTGVPFFVFEYENGLVVETTDAFKSLIFD